MQPTGGYLLDTNVLIEAHQRYYTIDFCPGFWRCLEHFCENARVRSIDRVREEISEGDALDDWVAQAPSELFASTADVEVVKAYSEIMRWVQNTTAFQAAAKEQFAQGADGWLVAYARVHRLVLITQEVFDPFIKRRVPIPNVCRQFDVPYQDTFSMLRALDVRFDWRGSGPS